MVDFTKVQTFDIPPDIKILKKTNASLAGENRRLKNILYVGIGTTFFLVYILFIKNKSIYVQPNQTISADQLDAD